MSQIQTKFIANDAITSDKLAANAVDATAIADGSVTNSKLSTGIDAAKLADGSVSNTELQYINSLSSNAQDQLDAKIDSSEKGVNNGVATLDAGGKVPAAQLPNSVMEFQGQWNATTNSPALADGTGSAGDVYRVDVAGSQDLGSGSITFAVGDWVIYSGSVWQKAGNSNDVVSVNSQTGVVVLDTDDIAEGTALYFTDERAQDAVGSAMTDTASIDFTYNDGSNQISAVVLPAGVDHDQLQNFVANEHVDHSTVSIATNSNSGLSGGGDLTSTRSLVIDPNNAPAETVASGDLVLIADVSAANALKKVTAQSIADLSPSPTYAKETVTLVSGDITAQKITLANTPIANSVMLIVKGGAPTLEGAAHDFTMSGADLNFENDLATGGASELVAGDILQVMYCY